MVGKLPKSRSSEKVNLPCLVKRKGTKAVYKDGLLEVMFQKQQDYNMSEVEIIPACMKKASGCKVLSAGRKGVKLIPLLIDVTRRRSTG